MNILLPILAAFLFIVIVALYVKGRDDAKTFDGEIRFVIWKIRNSPVDLAHFKHIEREFERLHKMKRKNKEQIQVAWVEYARKFIQFFNDEK